MRPVHRILIGLLIVVATIAGYSLGHILHPQRAPEPTKVAVSSPLGEELLNQPRPDFSLSDLQGHIHNISEWDGKVLLINFWATWCSPCREEIPLFQQLHDEYGADQFEVIGVALDLPDMVAEFQAELNITYPMLYGQDNADEAMRRYGNQAGSLPYSVLVDQQGFIRHIHDRRLKESQLRAWLVPLLAKNQ